MRTKKIESFPDGLGVICVFSSKLSDHSLH